MTAAKEAYPEPVERGIPLEECVAILSRIAATGSVAVDDVALHLRATGLLDALAAKGIAVQPERILPLMVTTTVDSEASILDLIVTLVEQSAGFAQALEEAIRARVATLAPDGDAGAAMAHAVRALLLVPAREIGAGLPRPVALANDFRREELVRAFAARIGAPIVARGAAEAREASARVLERLDYRRIREDEVRVAVERRVLAEHAERVRELQRQREAEALASAQRE